MLANAFAEAGCNVVSCVRTNENEGVEDRLCAARLRRFSSVQLFHRCRRAQSAIPKAAPFLNIVQVLRSSGEMADCASADRRAERVSK